MKKVLVGLFLLTAVSWLFYVFYTQVAAPLAFPSQKTANPVPVLESKDKKEAKEVKARFLIFTNGTKRVFTNPKYHNRSKEVYITAADPSVVTVAKPGITWKQFFASLPAPMKVTEDCLITGTGQEFCTNDILTLSFYLNGKQVTDILKQEIKPMDQLLISYGNEKLIEEQLMGF